MSDLQGRGTIHGIVRVGVGGGVTDYDELTNRPSINNHVVTGSKNGHDYELANLEDIIIKELNPTITPGVNYPRLNHIRDKNNQIFIVEYPWFSGRIAGLVPQALNPSGKVLNDSGNWVDITTPMETYDLLWDYERDNNNVIDYGNYTHILQHSIDDYKYLVIKFSSTRDDISNARWNQCTECYINVYILTHGYRPYRLTYTSFGDRGTAIWFDLTDNHDQVRVECESGNINGMTQIYGIK